MMNCNSNLVSQATPTTPLVVEPVSMLSARYLTNQLSTIIPTPTHRMLLSPDAAIEKPMMAPTTMRQVSTHTHQAHAAFCFSHTNSVCSRDRQTEHRSNEHHDEGTGHGGSHANNHSVRIILILLEQEANKRGETQRKHKQCATIHTIMISIMPLRKVPATCAPNNEAPRNSKMAAMMMACRTLTARDPTEVPNCTPPHTIIAKNH
jgi:hypothetical protein